MLQCKVWYYEITRQPSTKSYVNSCSNPKLTVQRSKSIEVMGIVSRNDNKEVHKCIARSMTSIHLYLANIYLIKY